MFLHVLKLIISSQCLKNEPLSVVRTKWCTRKTIALFFSIRSSERVAFQNSNEKTVWKPQNSLWYLLLWKRIKALFCFVFPVRQPLPWVREKQNKSFWRFHLVNVWTGQRKRLSVGELRVVIAKALGKTWKQMLTKPKIIKRSFEKVGLSLAVDGSQDNEKMSFQGYPPGLLTGLVVGWKKIICF